MTSVHRRRTSGTIMVWIEATRGSAIGDGTTCSGRDSRCQQRYCNDGRDNQVRLNENIKNIRLINGSSSERSIDLDQLALSQQTRESDAGSTTTN
ncbi:E3 ubiquitin-protein ligase listerin [Trichinella spiralis]|uniref:E3 ubiquitin-protein ligase listerin n=1 Tax=Trichinella spiralis TaxID=6334 RepID=A0ABR3K968_TRISP